MSYIAKTALKDLEDNGSYANEKGSHECVALVQKVAGAPNTGQWKRGVHVMTAPMNSILTGSVIATFDENGNYPSSERHAAIYVSHNMTGITVYDQWNKQGKSKQRTIRNKKLSIRDVNDADSYWVVEPK
jgi:hypothetical protein